MNVSVIGGSSCSEKVYKLAYVTGKLVAIQGWTLITGGYGGVMEAASKGAFQEKGITVGILSSGDTRGANPYLTVKLPTGLGYARNILVARMSDVLIAIDGKYGTLSEISFALNENKTVFGISTWDIKGIKKVRTPQEAIESIKKMFGK